MCIPNHSSEGRFGRLFNCLPPLYQNPVTLQSLGARGGPMDANNVEIKAQSIPLGMMFLGQFIDHDITLDTTSSLDRVNDVLATRNFRTPTLDLDCIYGLGPEGSPFLYRENVWLLTGKDGSCAPHQLEKHRNEDLARNSQGVAIIGDPRNDENRIISQLQLLFIRFHNSMVNYTIENIERKLRRKLSTEEFNSRSVEIFEEAQKLTRWHYQWIVIHEFLPIMVGKDLVHDILSSGRRSYLPKNIPFIPIEFSAAAYRFGHSLTPQRLTTQMNENETELFGRKLGEGFTPVNDDIQIVDWSLFFDVDDNNPPQKSNRLDTKLPTILLNLPFVRQGEKSLATRNLLRGQSFLLPSGESVADHMGISDALRKRTSERINELCAGVNLNCTPLWFYILAEADCIGKVDDQDGKPGEGLGPVGGRIVAETIIGLLELDPQSFLGSDRNWRPDLYKDDQFGMKELILFSTKSTIHKKF